MTFISYAQNFEDVLLHRALKHVANGNYLDIGAHDPIFDSVSLAFHGLGWKGVHVEPQSRYAAALREHRADDVVLQAAVGTSEGTITLYEVGDGYGLTTCSAEIAEQHEKRGYPVSASVVPCMPLSDVLDTFDGRDIHWMKIDVEGLEGDVLHSWGAHPARPWIVVIESTEPMSPVLNHHEWDPVLTGYGYCFAHFDGLNRYYVSDNHRELIAAFNCGPNYFDDFKVNPMHWVLPAPPVPPVSPAPAEAPLEEVEPSAAAPAALAEAHMQTAADEVPDDIGHVAQNGGQKVGMLTRLSLMLKAALCR